MVTPQNDEKMKNRNIQSIENCYTLFKEYCSLIEIIDEFSKLVFLKEVSKLLSKIYAVSLTLPEIDYESRNEKQIEKIIDQHMALAKIHIQKLKLSEVGPSVHNEDTIHGMDFYSWENLFLKLKSRLEDIDKYYIYETIFRNDKNEINQTSPSDDLADIYRDLKYCISLHENDKNKKDLSIQDFWRLSFDLHWGKHILNVLNTTHIRFYDNDEE